MYPLPGTDHFVQGFASNNSQSSGVNSHAAPGEQHRHWHFPNPIGGGNLAMIWFCFTQETAQPVPTVTDDTSTAWTVVIFQTDAGNAFQGAVAYRANCPAGVQSGTIDFSNKTAYVQTAGAEYWGVATTSVVDASLISAFNAAATTPWDPGNITTTTADALVLSCAFTFNGAMSYTGNSVFKPDPGSRLVSADLRYGFVSQYCKKAIAGSTPTSFTPPASAPFLGAAIAFKTDLTKGTKADTKTKPYVRRILYCDVNSATAPVKFQCPRSGNHIVCPTQLDLTATFADSAGNSYTRKNTVFQTNAGSVQFQYCLNPRFDGGQLVYTLAGPGTVDLTLSTMCFYDIEYDGQLYYDNFTDSNGVQTVSGDLALGSIAIARGGGITLGQAQSNVGTFREVLNVTNGYTSQEWDPAYYAVSTDSENAVAEDSLVWHAFPSVYSGAQTLSPSASNTVPSSTGMADWTSGMLSLVPTPPKAPRSRVAINQRFAA